MSSDQTPSDTPHEGRVDPRSFGVKSRDEISSGDLVIYPFLWSWESRRGIVQANKMRPCVALMRFDDETNDPAVILLAITTKPAMDWHDRMAIPPEECVRVGMDPGRGATIALNDMNIERIFCSRRLREKVPLRSFSPMFMADLAARFTEVMRGRRVSQVVRLTPPLNDRIIEHKARKDDPTNFDFSM